MIWFNTLHFFFFFWYYNCPSFYYKTFNLPPVSFWCDHTWTTYAPWSSSFFKWNVVFRSHNLGIKFAHCYWVVNSSRPTQWTKQANIFQEEKSWAQTRISDFNLRLQSFESTTLIPYFSYILILIYTGIVIYLFFM